MTEQRESSGSAFLRGLGTVLRVLVRFVFVIVIGTLIGVGLFYGVPWAYRRLVWPIRENTAQIAILQDQVAQNADSIRDNYRALQDRVVDLETEVAQLREATEAQAQQQESLTGETQQLVQLVSALEGDLESGLEAQRQAVEDLQSDLADATSDLEREVEEIQEQLDEARQELGQQLETYEDSLSDLATQMDETMARLVLLQAAQDLMKVRLLLVEENPGAARETLGLARAHLESAGELMVLPSLVLDDLRERLLVVDGLIAERSFRARPSLEALWAEVMDLVTPLTPRSTVTETQMMSPLPTPTPSP